MQIIFKLIVSTEIVTLQHSQVIEWTWENLEDNFSFKNSPSPPRKLLLLVKD